MKRSEFYDSPVCRKASSPGPEGLTYSCFEIDWNKSSTNNEGFPSRYYFHALGFQLFLILNFSSNGISVLNVKS